MPFQDHRGALRRHPIAAAVLALLLVGILVRAATKGALSQAIVYFMAIAAGVALVDAVLTFAPPRSPAIVVRKPASELAVATAIFAGGLAWLSGHFVWNYQPQGPVRLLWLLLLIGCAFDLFLFLFLLTRRYGLGDLGFRFSGLLAAPPVVAVFATFALLFTQSTITWSRLLEETGGTWLSVVATALVAAVPEEFFRFVWQTRAGALLNNRATGWLLASCLWATLHGPKDWDESHSIAATMMGMINIVPLGLLWGYVTHRTRSILPAVLIHATNVWGIQNLP